MSLSVFAVVWILLSVAIATPPVYLTCLIVYRLWFHPLAKYPGPLLAKVTFLYAGYHAWKGDLHLDMWRCHKKYGNYVRFAPNRLLINTNTGLKEIYAHNKQIQKSAGYSAMVHRAPNTLTLIDKKAHGYKRRIISQGFSDAAMRIFEPIILSHIRKLCEQMTSELPYWLSPTQKTGTKQWSTGQNMARWSNYLTFDIMSDVVFGEAFHLLEKLDNRFIVDCIEKSNVRTSVLLQASVIGTRKLDYLLFPESIRGRNIFIGFVNKLLQRRMNAIPLKRKDVFSNLLDAFDHETGRKLSMAEIGAESTTMIVAGSDTTSSAIASTFFYLLKNPETYIRAIQEVRSTFPSVESIKIGSKLNSCIYLRACIDESLRMSPPAASAPWREVVAGGVTIDGHHLPGGVDVGTSIYSIHHNPEYFPESFKYFPERWLPKFKEHCTANDTPSSDPALELAQSAFSPFSRGPRGCVGKGLAIAELTLTLAIVLRKFDIRVTPEAEKVGGGTPWATYGRHRQNEYQLYDHVTAAKDGPWMQFLEVPEPMKVGEKLGVIKLQAPYIIDSRE